MPAKHPSYPYVEPTPGGLSLPQIEARVDQCVQEWHFRIEQSMDQLCKTVGVDIEYSHYPNEIMLDAPLSGRPVIWLPRKGRRREDRVTVATALGHWALHVEPTRVAHPGCGVQALYHPALQAAQAEATLFGLSLLMPRADFCEAWYRGRSRTTADHFDVPTKSTYLRAESLLLDAVF